jgi:hypothetical protein
MARLDGRVAILTGGAKGIGVHYAHRLAAEGARLMITDVADGKELAEELARKHGANSVASASTDVSDEGAVKLLVAKTMERFGKIDILVNNAAFQMTREDISEISTEEFDRTLKTNLYAMFWLTRAAVPHMPEGGTVINTSSIQADNPSPQLLAYAMTKAGIQNFTGGLAQMLGKKGIRANCVAPGPIWTPLIPATMPPEKVKTFGKDVALGRAGQPAELAPVFVLLASEDSSYMAGATVAVTGGKPLI